MRKLSVPRGGGEKVGVLALEVAALMSRAAGLWRALDADSLARLRGEGIRLEGVRRLVADDDAALLALALAEMAAACRDLSRDVSRLSARCADPLLRRFDALFAALVKRGAGGGGDPHGLRYAAAKKMDRKARKMQRLVAVTAHLCHELDVLAELEQQQQQQAYRPRARGGAKGAAAVAAGSSSRAECSRRVARQRQEVERLRAASLWARTFDYAVRLLARSLFTIVARIIEVFDLEPVALLLSASASVGDDDEASSRASRLSWSTSFVSGSMQLQSMVYPSDAVIAAAADAPRKTMLLRTRSGKGTATGAGDARRFFMSRSKSLRQQLSLRWPGAAGKHLIGCVVMDPSRSPGRDGWNHADDAAHLPLSFSYVSSAGSAADDFSGSGIISFHCQAASGGDARRRHSTTTTTAVFASSSRDVVTHPPESSLGAAALALHYANLIMFIEKLAASPLHICPDERDTLYGMLTDRIRASLRARLRRPAALAATTPPCDDPVLAAQWSDTVRRILAWLAPLAHNMVRWQAERKFEQQNVAFGDDATVLLLQTLHFADQRKTEAAVTELLVGLNYMWRHGTDLEAKVILESAAGPRRQL
ncbi:uncharacterized protein [Miscanthus floridulus]|uniref:uncharacterized protein n=1 Tax=Miscanthus floridulus TaxID=154761 RepID=UPI0034596B52